MKISILIPSYNNLKYLKFTVESILKNSNFTHQILIHVNDGSDGSLEYVKKKNIEYTHSPKNIGLCHSINQLSKKIETNHVLYSHDDMFFCKNWDNFLIDEVKKFKNELYYLTGTNISVNKGLINYSCGNSPDDFDEPKFNKFCITDKSHDLQGSHWAPHLVHRNVWEKVGGFSHEFNPGDGSDPDFCMKLWKNGVRIFKTISKFKVYHFSSITTRKRDIILNNGTKTFLLKYGFNPRFFRKYYLRGDGSRPFDGKLKDPKFNLIMLLEYLVNKLKYHYFNFLR